MRADITHEVSQIAISELKNTEKYLNCLNFDYQTKKINSYREKIGV